MMHYQLLLNLLKDQPEDGPLIGPKHVAAFIILKNVIKYKFVYVLYYIDLNYILEGSLFINFLLIFC